jgi:predicted  nucleic acid-binding Zn-ribbon protein
MPDVVESVRKLLQDLVAPELRELKSDVKRVEAKIENETKRLEDKIDSMEDKMDTGFAQLRSALENANLRAELEATRDIANLRERVTRLEVERGIQRQ